MEKPTVEHISPISSIQEVEHQLFDEKPDLSLPAIKHYFASRLSTLFDLPMYHTDEKWYKLINPLSGLKHVTRSNWNYYLLGYLAWTIDALDFFTTMLRSVGAIIFGTLADYIGRKFTYCIITFLFIPIEIAGGFVTNYQQFQGVRALFGILMGGMYSISMVTAIEEQDVRARGALSGIFLPGYSFGYLLAMVFYRAFALTGKKNEGWRNLLFFTAGLSAILLIWRLLFPEGPNFLKLKERRRQYNEQNKEKRGNGFLSKFDLSIFRYGVDLDLKTIIIVVSNLAAMVGGLFMGNVSEILGRRLTIIICSLWNIALTWSSFNDAKKHWPVSNSFNGPIHLMELVNPTHRALLAGLAYQLGNLASSASSTIEATIGLRFPLGEGMYDYGKVMGIFCYCVFGAMIICLVLGPERFHRELQIVDEEELVEEISASDYSVKERV
ncbi:unnamed protein product [Candida verbasci]|uniref:Major facilitator superfamily (MFS) profile domain-containing protein n=1 Tax=Candida verbasci TaxID=1227364 RepID=A0A9W4X876_9ASCO|nr:unnamed protein product [Candida verbasci]